MKGITMKQVEVALARGQDPDRTYKSGLYLRLLAEEHAEIVKVVRMFETWIQTGKLDDLKKLRRELRKAKVLSPKLANARMSFCEQFGDWSEDEHRLVWFCTSGCFKAAAYEADGLVKEAIKKTKAKKKGERECTK